MPRPSASRTCLAMASARERSRRAGNGRRIRGRASGPRRVDRVEHLLPARRRRGFAAQHAAAEFEIGIAEGLGQVRRHRVADLIAQIGLPLLGLEPADQRVELREQRRIGQRYGVVVDALRLEEIVQLQALVLLAEFGRRHRRVIAARIAEQRDRLGRLRDAGFQIDHRLRFGRELRRLRAGQRQDLLDVIVVAADQRLGVGIAAGIVRRIGQAQAALPEVTDVAVELVQVDVRAEIERHRDADLVQRGDRGRHVLGLLDAVDAGQQRRDRIGAVGFDRRFVQAAGPEVAEQFLHVALRRPHGGVEQFALLLQARSRSCPSAVTEPVPASTRLASSQAALVKA